MNFSFLKKVVEEWFDRTVPYPTPDPNGLQGQCVQFVRWLLMFYYKLPQWGAIRGAADFWDNYDNDPNLNRYWEKLPNTPTFVPQEGDIVIWDKSKGGGYGHVGVVFENDHSVNYFYSAESNWKPFKVTVVQHNYNGVLGFFRVKQ